jgi:hypothetical protein
VIHEGMVPRSIEGNKKFSFVLDQNDVLPSCEMSRWRRAQTLSSESTIEGREATAAQHAEWGAVSRPSN